MAIKESGEELLPDEKEYENYMERQDSFSEKLDAELDDPYVIPDIDYEGVDLDSSTTIFDIFDKFNEELTTHLEPLHESLPFLKDGINLLMGESKAGKTYTTIKSLVDNGFKDSIIHIDFDRNSDLKLKELEVETYHISETEKFIEDLSTLNERIIDSLREKIIVLDSLQDLSYKDGLDSNYGALDTMNKVLFLKQTGATLIVIHHITLDTNNKSKIKGNASVITSKADTTISFTKDKSVRTMKVENTRAEDKIPSGTKIDFGKNNTSLKKLTNGKK